MLKTIVKVMCFAVVVLTVSWAAAMAQSSDVPNGLAKKGYVILSVCDCLAVEIRQSVFFNSERLNNDLNLRASVGTLTVNGSMECTEPNIGESDLGLRFVLFLLDGISPFHQEFCRP